MQKIRVKDIKIVETNYLNKDENKELSMIESLKRLIETNNV